LCGDNCTCGTSK